MDVGLSQISIACLGHGLGAPSISMWPRWRTQFLHCMIDYHLPFSKTFLTCCASINNSYDSETWDQMTAIKSRIFRIWDTAPPGIRMCCIKFAQRVVLCQTNGFDSEIRVSDIRVG